MKKHNKKLLAFLKKEHMIKTIVKAEKNQPVQWFCFLYNVT